jgi:hypothetical protein
MLIGLGDGQPFGPNGPVRGLCDGGSGIVYYVGNFSAIDTNTDPILAGGVAGFNTVTFGNTIVLEAAQGPNQGATGVVGAVNTCVYSSRKLYIGGEFSSLNAGSGGAELAFGVAVFNFWDYTWARMLSGDGSVGFNAPVHALIISGGVLLAGGAFTQTSGPLGAGTTVAGLAIWNGGEWLPVCEDPSSYSVQSANGGQLPQGVATAEPGSDAVVRALASYGTDVIVGGEFTSVAGVNATNVARVDMGRVMQSMPFAA